jgi:hypothetical protein
MGGKEPDVVLGYARVEPTSDDAEVRRNLASPCVTYVGSHEGCGCGFNSGLLEFEGIEDEAQLAPLLGALLESERKEYLAQRRSREHLHGIVVSALRDGPVVLYSCWAGDEGEAPVAEESVDAGWLLRRTAPLKERVRYRLTG